MRKERHHNYPGIWRSFFFSKQELPELGKLKANQLLLDRGTARGTAHFYYQIS